MLQRMEIKNDADDDGNGLDDEQRIHGAKAFCNNIYKQYFVVSERSLACLFLSW